MASNPGGATVVRNQPVSAPNFSLHREAQTGADAAVGAGQFTNINTGINCRYFQRAHVQVDPTALSDPSIEILFWNVGAERFVAPATAITVAGKGVGIPYEFSFDVENRVFMVRITAQAAGSCDVYVSGSRHSEAH